MSNLKTEFKLEVLGPNADRVHGKAMIIGEIPESRPYVAICFGDKMSTNRARGFIQDKDLERFAVNILKALKSKRLKP